MGGPDGVGPLSNAGVLRGFGGDGANDGAVNSGAVHGGEQAVHAAIGAGFDVGAGFEGGDRLGGQGVGEGVGVEVYNHPVVTAAGAGTGRMREWAASASMAACSVWSRPMGERET